ncbi:prevent-host-death protein [Campylobacter sp. MIT 99-7217]|uniref:type II toxin-antitoxin system Phd/YefM family antitoxin n=1 Tax=Campylobacter sp. MIT 99-7217 TaxID=535091 RepID=UPI00115B6291|nr:type II toxin-antitoxin system Phd/YefM family antitoxin [Campylobacter sp. MIT 99-7217]TQR34631.1 prevent-host-death protein [Campylobacter sp. MIT 99-7217]
MLSFSQDEIFTATELVRNFSTILNQVSTKDKKVVILKNNKFEAVMLSVKEYEKLYDAMKLLESIYQKNQK